MTLRLIDVMSSLYLDILDELRCVHNWSGFKIKNFRPSLHPSDDLKDDESTLNR